jgi:periplasmic copper chaperone A
MGRWLAFLIPLAALLMAPPALAAAPGIQVEKAWARAAPGSAGVAYFAISNSDLAADRLTGASTPVAAAAEMHVMVMDGAVMQMRPVDAVDVRPGERVEFKPGGLHLMLLGLKNPLKQGDRFPLTLEFEKAGKIEVEVLVLPIGATGFP